MSNENKRLSEALMSSMDGMPEAVKESFIKDWTAEARGAKKICDMVGAAAENSPA